MTRDVLRTEGVSVLRLGRFERWVLIGILIVAFSWIGVYQFTLGDLGDTLIGVGFIAVAAVCAWLANRRVLLAYSDDYIVVRNVFRTVALPGADLVNAFPTYEGLRLEDSRGTRVKAVAVPRWNLSLVLRRESRADRVAAELLSSGSRAASRGRGQTQVD